MIVDRFSASILGMLVLFPCSLVFAGEENSGHYQDRLLGNIGGIRSKLADKGVEVTVEYKADVWSVVSGGTKRGNNYLDNLDIKFDLDNEKLLGLKGNKAFISFINNNGGKPNANRVGSTQGIDNIETATNTAKLYEAWVEQSFFADKLSVLVGLHDLNTEFDVNEMTANFIKPVFQVEQSFAQSGRNGPSVFPTTSVAGRIKFQPNEAGYISAAVFDGVPGNPSNPHGTHIDFEGNDGLLLVAEGGFSASGDKPDGIPYMLALGAWRYTKKFDDLVDLDGNGNPIQQHVEGAYFLSSCQFYRSKESGRTLGIFLNAGIADGDTAQTDWNYETGIVGSGWIPTRPDGEIGLGIAQAHNSSKYMRSVSGNANSNEYGLELYYRDSITNGISVQPDLQYVINPSTNPTLKNATIIGLRLDVNF